MIEPYPILVADGIRVMAGGIVWLVGRVAFIDFDWWHPIPQRIHGFNGCGVYVGAIARETDIVLPQGVFDATTPKSPHQFLYSEVYAERSLALRALLAQGKTYATDEMIDSEYQTRWGRSSRWYGWQHEIEKAEEEHRAKTR